MKIIIAGTRTLKVTVEDIEEAVLCSGFQVTEVLEGESGGVDTAAREWARRRDIPVTPYPARWKRAKELYGNDKLAGPLRNERMARHGKGLILIWNGHSPGSKDMYNQATRYGLPIFQIIRDE